jgi:Xaa-Pro aminopeptidase
MQIDEIQNFLRENQIDGWLLYDFRESNPIARRVTGLAGRHITRRWFCYVPATGEPIWLTHRIELSHFNDLPGEVRVYTGWRELHEELRTLLANSQKVAVEYSPDAAVPYVAKVDAGTVELVRGCGVEVISSADLVQRVEARWTDSQLAGHQESARLILEAKDLAFAWIGEQLKANRRVTEYDVQRFILERFDAMNLVADHPPIAAVNANSGDPHYAPTAERRQPIQRGDFVLIDLWAKQRAPDAVYADTTWVGYVGETVPERYATIFEIVRRARDRAITFIREMFAAGRTVYGYAVDDVVRDYITAKGYGEFFVHRTGHSIGVEVHGNGVNIDNLETRDERPLIPGVCFSIEPGIYLPDFGVRSELDVFLAHLTPDGVIVTTAPVQNAVLTLL